MILSIVTMQICVGNNKWGWLMINLSLIASADKMDVYCLRSQLQMDIFPCGAHRAIRKLRNYGATARRQAGWLAV
jgi:hypothetical protein